MNIRVLTQDFTLTPAVGAWVHERNAQVLGRFADDVIAVDVYLKDISESIGSDDKQALVRARLRSGPPVLTESLHSDICAAIDLAARRSQRAVRRTLKKKHRLSRGDTRRMRYVQTLTADL